MRNFYIKVSKFLSYILRHSPGEFGIILDSEGFTELNLILTILNERYKNSEIIKGFIENLIKDSDKKRFEIREEEIRANYGHNIDEKVLLKEITYLPSKLYHGTNLSAYEKIKNEGIKKIGRQYVHLSEDIKPAITVGKHRTTNPVVLVVNTVIA